MKFPYSVKGCSHCDNRQFCPKKNSESNMTKEVRKIKDKGDGLKMIWETFCKDFIRMGVN